jgi:hypothetical protein
MCLRTLKTLLNPKGGCMKKLLVLALVLSMATMASAALQITAGGDRNATEITLLPSDIIELGIWTDAQISAGIGESGGWGLVISNVATISGGVSLFPTEPGISIFDDIVGNLGLPVPEGTNGVGGMILITGVIANIPGQADIYNGITIHCNGPGDAVISLVLANDDYSAFTVVDSIIVHQIPEPFTMGLLGLGGLFLRRRK